MQIQVNTDKHIEGSTELTLQVEAVVEGSLSRFGDRVTRVEVYLSDENSSQKGGGTDKRCRMEARLAGLQPITVTADGPSLDHVLNGAADKLEKTLTRNLDRKSDPKGRTSFAGDQTI